MIITIESDFGKYPIFVNVNNKVSYTFNAKPQEYTGSWLFDGIINLVLSKEEIDNITDQEVFWNAPTEKDCIEMFEGIDTYYFNGKAPKINK